MKYSILHPLKIKKKDLVLDVGCWNGEKIKNLLGKCNPYGLEIDKSKLYSTPKEIKKRIFLGDITKKNTLKEVSKKRFDLIFLEEVLEHIEEDELALKNINSLLKEKGKFVITTPKSILFLEFWDPAWIRWKFFRGQRHHHYTQEELNCKLKKSGFIIKKIRLTGNIKWLFFRWVNAFLKNIFKSKKQYICEKNEGFFDWEILAIKK